MKLHIDSWKNIHIHPPPHCGFIHPPLTWNFYSLQLKSFVKKCKIPNYTKKMKQLLDKIKENKDFIEAKRKDVSFGIAEMKAVKDWEVRNEVKA